MIRLPSPPDAPVTGPATTSVDADLQRRAQVILDERRQTIFRRTDKMFAVLLVLQWIGAVAAACCFTPWTWSGGERSVHPHVWMALVMGGVLSSIPVLLVWARSGAAITRHAIAISQILFSSLLIHITGGRIETHFHIFGSLAFLAAYRDWRLLIPATALTAADHLVRGLFWPDTMFGDTAATSWRWVEHAGWVLFEDTFLILIILQSSRELAEMSLQTAVGERHQESLEQLVAARTEELRTAKESAECANRAKSSFLANMSHEIRTPMTAIMGYTETLLEPEQSPADRHEALQVIRRSTRHLLELINDVLDISKIEANKMTVERIPVDLPQTAADVVSLLRPSAIGKGLDLRLTFADGIPRTIHSDPLRLKQILMNLLGNAVKFTERGEIHLHVSSETRGQACLVHLDVRDTGLGMTPSQIERLFEPFTQADESTTRRFGGTGLGLTISKRLAEMLGGSLTVNSISRVGSLFRLTVDAGRSVDMELLHGLSESSLGVRNSDAPRAEIRLSGRVLLVEDGPDNQKLISLHLRKAGATVEIAENGRIALEAMEAHQFDVILMDMQMPELDGYGATRELRRRGCPLPIIALTAHAMSDDRRRCLAAGCTDYLTKPIEKQTLLTTIAAYLPGSLFGSSSDSKVDHSPSQDAGSSDAGLDADASALPAKTIRSVFADDPDMAEILAEFVATLPDRVAALEEHFETNNLAELLRLTHQLKGAGGGFGFDSLTAAAADLEQAVKQGLPPNTVRRNLDSLLTLIRSIAGYDLSKEPIHV